MRLLTMLLVAIVMVLSEGNTVASTERKADIPVRPSPEPQPGGHGIWLDPQTSGFDDRQWLVSQIEAETEAAERTRQEGLRSTSKPASILAARFHRFIGKADVETFVLQ